MKVKAYRLTLNSDNGTHTIITTATSKKVAIEKVCNAEMCPPRSIKKVEIICLIDGVTYPEILEIQKKIRDLGIEANITIGALKVYSDYENPEIISICKEYNTLPAPYMPFL